MIKMLSLYDKMALIRNVGEIDTKPILESYFKLEENMHWYEGGTKGRQSGLQYKPGEDPWFSAVGVSKGQELTYTEINPFFKDTIFEELINKYNVKRARLLWVNPMSCYSIHRDTTPRLHIPLITNPQCFFVFKQGLIEHLSVGRVYKLKTTELHTFMNCSEEGRLHFIGVLDPEKE